MTPSALSAPGRTRRQLPLARGHVPPANDWQSRLIGRRRARPRSVFDDAIDVGVFEWYRFYDPLNRSVQDRLRGFLASPEPAAQLALLRIVVPAMILWTPEVRHAPELAAVPAILRVAPEGLRWFAANVPISPGIATTFQVLCAFAAFAAMVGVYTRPALIVLAVTATYLFSLSQLSGAVWHDMHLLWMAALLAASPCDEALAFDHRGAPAELDSARYGVPLLFARLLLACIYFFPGLHKLHTSGLAWALSDNLRNQMWWKWAEHGTTAMLRVDRVPGFLPLGGLLVLAFELGFPVLALRRRTRPLAALGGLAFHLFAGVLFQIPFVSLWALYVVLVNPLPFVRRILRRPALATNVAAAPPWRATWVVGALLVAGAFVQGVRGQMRSYPFACYPTFEWMVGTELPDLSIVAVTGDGEHHVVAHARDPKGYRTQRQWGEIWGLAGVTLPLDRPRLEAYAVRALRRDPELAKATVRLECRRASLSVVPEERGLPPRRGALLLTVTPKPVKP